MNVDTLLWNKIQFQWKEILPEMFGKIREKEKVLKERKKERKILKEREKEREWK